MYVGVLDHGSAWQRACLLQAVNLGLQIGDSLHAALAQPLRSPPVPLAPA